MPPWGLSENFNPVRIWAVWTALKIGWFPKKFNSDKLLVVIIGNGPGILDIFFVTIGNETSFQLVSFVRLKMRTSRLGMNFNLSYFFPCLVGVPDFHKFPDGSFFS